MLYSSLNYISLDLKIKIPSPASETFHCKGGYRLVFFFFSALMCVNGWEKKKLLVSKLTHACEQSLREARPVRLDGKPVTSECPDFQQ